MKRIMSIAVENIKRREIRKSLKQARKDKKTNDIREKKQPKPFLKQ